MIDLLPALPYPGLRAFHRDESLLFFGRENNVDAMIERLAATRFLAVLGASGSGKSSLVRTGLFDALELGFFARAGARWKIIDMHPGDAPIRNLAEQLAHASGPDGLPPALVEALLSGGARGVVEWAKGADLAPGENLLIFVDQFEELFRYADFAAREAAESFVALLLESARDPVVPIHVVITMRSEYLGACALIPGLAEQINAGFYLTPRMNREECRRAIEGPAAVFDFAIEPALVNQLLNDMASFAPWEDASGVTQAQILSRRADQLPLMQHLLNQLWQRAYGRGDRGNIRLTSDDYHAVGGLGGALEQHGAKLLDALTPNDRDYAKWVFRALVSGPDVTNAIRRPQPLKHLVAEGDERGTGGGEAVLRIVETFRSPGCNFLQPPAITGLTPDSLIDISHESLIRQWPALANWLQDEARAEGNWRRLLTAATRHQTDDGDLLAGRDLERLDDWTRSERPTATWADRYGGNQALAFEFLDKSRQERDVVAKELQSRADRENLRQERERQELRKRLIITYALLILTFCALTFAVWNQFVRQNAEASLASLEAEKRILESENKNMQTNLITQRSIFERDRTFIDKQKSQLLEKIKALEASEREFSRKSQAEQAKYKTALGLMGVTTNFEYLIDYCSERTNEPACAILYGAGTGKFLLGDDKSRRAISTDVAPAKQGDRKR